MGNTQTKGLKRIYNAFFYSMAGLASSWKHEAAFRQETCLAILLIPAAFWLGHGSTQMAILVFSVFLVLITELLNSAIEAAIDRIGDQQHELSKRAKDIGSATVLMSLIAFTVVWGLIIIERFAI